MRDRDIEAVTTWLVEAGLAGLPEGAMLQGFCARCREAGLRVARGLTLVDMPHPVYEGQACHWREESPDEAEMMGYGRTDQGEANELWLRSAFYHIVSTGAADLRCDLVRGDHPDFDRFAGYRDDGYTDIFSIVTRFAAETAVGEMECLYSNWLTRAPGGFTDDDLAALRRLVPVLALALKGASLGRVADTLAEVYLGRDAGHRVLSGGMVRGRAETIDAVLWFSDLRGFTTISDEAPPGELIPLLNDYAEAAISAVEQAGGDVLKLIGDGILAIFDARDHAAACAAALGAEVDLRARVAGLNARRAAEERPTTTVTLGLHLGRVFYGNIGSDTRLDFTVVGPAVNEVSRISALCRSADREVLLSRAFRDAAPEAARGRIVSVGRYALRGLARAQELFTLDAA